MTHRPLDPESRRRFLQQAGRGALALGASVTVPALGDVKMTDAAPPSSTHSAVFGRASPDESLLAAARAEQPATIEALRRMVEIESGSHDASGLERMADYVAGRLAALGATVTRVPATNGKPPGLVEGVLNGRGRLRVLLIAHMDTVYHKDVLRLEPYRREGNRVYGPGIADDKGGIAVILGALAILRQQGWRDYGQITALFNGDEEIGSPGSGSIIEKMGGENDVVLSYEPSPAKAVAGHEGVLLKAAGIGRLRLEVHGRAAHAGAAPEDGRNALIELAYQLIQTREGYRSAPGSQMYWTTAASGTANNQIPATAEAGADVRITEPGAGQKLFEKVKAKVAEGHLVPDTRSDVHFQVTRPIFVAGDKGMALARLAQSIYTELGAGDLEDEFTRELPADAGEFRELMFVPVAGGGTDAGFAAASGKPAVLESLGLAGWGYHAKNEYIEVDSIVPRLYLTARMLMELGARAEHEDGAG
ncbi:MAG TPA: glutamate carboxypeptidase [Nevskiaceae bacterium]